MEILVTVAYFCLVWLIFYRFRFLRFNLLPEGDFTDTPLQFGASGLAAIFTSKAIDLVKVLRMIEIQSESLLNYIYNPF